MPSKPKALYRCAGCQQFNRPSGYVLCRDCWRSKVPQSAKVVFNRARGYEVKMAAARVIIELVTKSPE